MTFSRTERHKTDDIIINDYIPYVRSASFAFCQKVRKNDEAACAVLAEAIGGECPRQTAIDGHGGWLSAGCDEPCVMPEPQPRLDGVRR